MTWEARWREKDRVEMRRTEMTHFELASQHSQLSQFVNEMKKTVYGKLDGAHAPMQSVSLVSLKLEMCSTDDS